MKRERLVKTFTYNEASHFNPDGKKHKAIFHERNEDKYGWFLEYGLGVYSCDDNSSSFTGGIIEFPDGTVRLVELENFVFSLTVDLITPKTVKK